MNIFHIVNNKWVRKNVPSTKQIGIKSTNKTIECSICSTKNKPMYLDNEPYLRILDLFAYADGIIRIKGYSHYNCALGMKLRHDKNDLTIFIDNNGKRVDIELVRQGMGKWNEYKKMTSAAPQRVKTRITKVRIKKADPMEGYIDGDVLGLEGKDND